MRRRYSLLCSIALLGSAAVFLGGCAFDRSGLPGTDDGGAGSIDASPIAPDSAVSIDASSGAPDATPGAPDAGPGTPDATPGAPDASCLWSYTPRFFTPCGPLTPSPPVSLNEVGRYVYDTDSGVLTTPSGAMRTPDSNIVAGARALVGEGFTLGTSSALRLIGSRPFMIISTGSITIDGTLSANSFWDVAAFSLGAGADPSVVCPLTPPNAGATCLQHGGSGGGGGAFGGAGGNGGRGAEGHTCLGFDGIDGGLGGFALVTPPLGVRGGCGGRDGAQNNSGTADRGRGAPGGGALHLTAKNTITVNGTIHVGGGGGRPGLDNRSGGGGGGSGGYIGLEAGTIQIRTNSVLAANGGGGGGGCDNAAASPGDDGRPSDQPALGGDGQGNGDQGRDGGYLGTPEGLEGDNADRGGGGGGGGAGFVILYSPNTPIVQGNAIISPAPTVP